MMTPKQEAALRLAREALDDRTGLHKWQKAREAIDEALAEQPAQRKPLTDEEIILIVAECAASHQHTDIHFARAIERAHGIKGLV